jgi:hypothetical protein
MKKILVVIFIAMMVAVSLVCCWIFGAFADNSILRGDANKDGLLNGKDIVSIEQMVLQKIPKNLEADVNEDGSVNMLDIPYLEFKIINMKWGDANQDGKLNMADVVTVERMILMDYITPEADANQNGQVDMGDVVWIERMILLAP